MLSALQFFIFLLSFFIEDFVFVSFQKEKWSKKGKHPDGFQIFTFRSRIDLFDVKDFQKKFDRW